MRIQAIKLRSISVVGLCLFLAVGLSWTATADDRKIFSFSEYWGETFGEPLPKTLFCDSTAFYRRNLKDDSTETFKDDFMSRGFMAIDFEKQIAFLKRNRYESDWLNEIPVQVISKNNLLFGRSEQIALASFSELGGEIVLAYQHSYSDAPGESKDYFHSISQRFVCTANPEQAFDPLDKVKTTGECTGCDLSYSDLAGVRIFWGDLSGANLTGANMVGVDLERADLTGANLTMAKMTGSNLTKADLTGANLTGAELYGSYLWQADLTNADLSTAKLSGADLSGANLSSAKLIGTDLTRTDLIIVNFTGADLSGAAVYGANMADAIFCNTTMPNGEINDFDC